MHASRRPAGILLALVPGALAAGVAAAALAAPAAAPNGAQEAAIAQLTQQMQTLRLQTDLELRQLRQELDRLRERVRQLDDARLREQTLGARSTPTPTPALPPARGTSDQITTRRLVIEDEEGRMRAILGTSASYGPMLVLLDPAGMPALMASLPAAGPRLELLDGEPRAILSLAEEGPTLTLLDRAGTPAVALRERQGHGTLDLTPER